MIAGTQTARADEQKMKTLTVLILSCVALRGANIVNTTNVVGDMSTRSSERLGKNGKPDLRIESVYRGKVKVMQTISHRNRDGALAVILRSYLADGKLLAVESDDDEDGTLETVTVFDPDNHHFEMFSRQPDGMVKPVSTRKLNSLKKQKAVADESLRKLLETPKIGDKELRALLEQNRQKIKAIKQEKTKSGD